MKSLMKFSAAFLALAASLVALRSEHGRMPGGPIGREVRGEIARHRTSCRYDSSSCK